MVNQSRIRGAREEALSGLEGQLEVVGLELMAVHIRRAGGREFQILRAATLKLREPNEVRTNGAHNKLVFESLRERVE